MSNSYMFHSSTSTFDKEYEQAHGPIIYNMTNDYMFRAVLQSNKIVLRGLICSLLHFKPSEIQEIQITNPIQLGQTMDAKDFILDINVMLNNNTLINLEMQVNNLHNWPERSLCYLCRSFDNLNSGDDYLNVKPAIQISILDFKPFPEAPEFYSSYKMLNTKNHHLYSDKFTLHVLSLKHINLATDEDQLWSIDHWARMFKVKTWEELKMLANTEPDFIELSKEMFKQHADETIRQQCLARKEAEGRERCRERKIAQLTADIETLTSENESLSSENESLSSEIKLLKKFLADNNLSLPDNPK